MNVIYPPGSEKWPEKTLIEQATKELEAIVEPANKRLEAIPGAPVNLVTATWQRIADPGKPPRYRLTLKDSTGEATADFTRELLQLPDYVFVRLGRLWGELLGIRADVLHREAMLLCAQLAEENEQAQP